MNDIIKDTITFDIFFIFLIIFLGICKGPFIKYNSNKKLFDSISCGQTNNELVVIIG
jgi:exopolysaccharide biosynthesis protein